MRRISVTDPPGFRVSFTEVPVSRNNVRMSVMVAPGATALATAQAPVTMGAAIEVPFCDIVPPPGTDDSMSTPGASKSRNEATLENEATTGWSHVAPTLMTVEMQAGAPKLVL